MIDRTQWVSALTALPTEKLLSLGTALSTDFTIRPKALPQSGLGMLKLNDGAFNQPFYLGEIPLASVWIEVETADGRVVEGAAQVMDDRIEVAEALAVCDATLANHLQGWEQVLVHVEQGVALRAEEHKQRKQMLAATQVDFSLLDEAGDSAGKSAGKSSGENTGESHVKS